MQRHQHGSKAYLRSDIAGAHTAETDLFKIGSREASRCGDSSREKLTFNEIE